MIKYLIPFIFIFSFCASAQQKYWVFLHNKKSCEFNPYEYFDAKAIDRRIINEVPLVDSTDFPLNENYKKEIQIIATEITGETRWFNALAVIANQEQIEKIQKLPFVNEIQKMNSVINVCSSDFDASMTEEDKELLTRQLESMQGNLFDQNGINGKGVRIAIFDGGFPMVDKSPVFQQIRENGRIIKTYDFAKKKDFVYSYSSHGTMVMSCIGGILKKQKIGLATDAEFLLARTEVNTEPYSEEENWLAAVEWSDKNGVQIINSSLGYTNDRYFNEDMNGRKSLVSRAASLAARKGILVVSAMGNDGSSKWKYIAAPADADSIISVGGIDPNSDYHISFSSYGPTADKRLKPNVCAYGDVIVSGKKSIENVQGTSFSSPLVAGFAACALQLNPKIKTMDLLNEIEKSGNLYPYFDYAHGYGVPQASHFTSKTNIEAQATVEFTKDDNFLIVSIKENIQAPAYKTPNYLYYHIQNTKGTLDKYSVIKVIRKEALKIPINEINNNETVRVYYMGYTGTFTLNTNQ